MKALTINKLTRNALSGILIMMLIFTLDSCAVKSAFVASSIVPGAQGNIKVKRDNNKNYVIKVQITNLAEVEKLQTFKHNYVVWMLTDQGNIENLGLLKSSKGLFTKKREASLDAVSSYKPSKIFITAEDNSDVQNPTDPVVLTTAIF